LREYIFHDLVSVEDSALLLGQHHPSAREKVDDAVRDFSMILADDPAAGITAKDPPTSDLALEPHYRTVEEGECTLGALRCIHSYI
jgi:hypothetical protein